MELLVPRDLFAMAEKGDKKGSIKSERSIRSLKSIKSKGLNVRN
jgi:hypothetical protein